MKTWWIYFILFLFIAACEEVPLTQGPPAGENPLPVGESEYKVKGFSGTYRIDNNGSCSSFFELGYVGYEPDVQDKVFPLFLYTVGTLDNYQNPVVHEILRAVASFGFVAVSVQYYNAILGNCSDGYSRASCIYRSDETESAVSKICSKPNVDCSQIITMGHSQGAGLALFAKNINSNVKAALLVGATSDVPSDLEFGVSNPDPNETEFNCLHYTNLDLSGDKVRIINGENEPFGTPEELSRMIGLSCPSEQSNCLNSDGSGWYIVSNSEVEDSDADHNFFVFADTEGDRLDSGFLNSRNEWSLLSGVSWLKSMVD